MTFRKRTICKALLPCFSSSWRRSKSVHIHPEVEIWEYELAASASTQSASHLPSRFDPAQGEESGHLTVPMPSGEPNVNTSSSQGQDLDCSTFKNTSCSRLIVPLIVIPDETENPDCGGGGAKSQTDDDALSGNISLTENESDISISSFAVISRPEEAIFPPLSWCTYDNKRFQSISDDQDQSTVKALQMARDSKSLASFPPYQRGSPASVKSTLVGDRPMYTQSTVPSCVNFEADLPFIDHNAAKTIAQKINALEADEGPKKVGFFCCGRCSVKKSESEGISGGKNTLHVFGTALRRKPDPWISPGRTRRHTSDQYVWRQQLETAIRNSGGGSQNGLKGSYRIGSRLPRLHEFSEKTDAPPPEPDGSREPKPEDFFDFLEQLGSGSYGKFALYIVMEYLPGGSLTKRLTEPFSPVAAAFYSAQIALGIMYLHSQGILFRDLKPDNVLFTEHNNLKICDFGSCLPGCFGKKNVKVSTGTPRYWAPEKLTQKSYARPADWWSLGLILFQMLNGRFPFSNSEPGYCAFTHEVLTAEPKYDSKLPKDAISCCKGLLTKAPDRRLGGPEEYECLTDHPFYRRRVDWKKLEALTARPPPMYAHRHASMPTYIL
ncbi:uncharacterized protein [Littorina saxatilis]|uniref:uncharacterized protein isoform X2 n=1 Tax=Littorina saxatilis TaxID=31220 RepID=UPI0038B51D5F